MAVSARFSSGVCENMSVICWMKVSGSWLKLLSCREPVAMEVTRSSAREADMESMRVWGFMVMLVLW